VGPQYLALITGSQCPAPGQRVRVTKDLKKEETKKKDNDQKYYSSNFTNLGIRDQISVKYFMWKSFLKTVQNIDFGRQDFEGQRSQLSLFVQLACVTATSSTAHDVSCEVERKIRKDT